MVYSVSQGLPGGVANVPIEAVTDGKFHAVYFLYMPQEKIQGGVTAVQFNGK